MAPPPPNPPPHSNHNHHLTLFVTFHIDPSKLKDWYRAHRPVWSHIAATPECIYFDVFSNPAVPGQMRLVEMWNRDRAWFEREQLTKPYYATLWEESRPTWTREVEIEYWERAGEGMSWKEEFLVGGVKGG